MQVLIPIVGASSFSQRIDSLQQQIECLQKSASFSSAQELESEYKKYIDSLHRYNDVKDVTQSLLGKLAEMTQRTITELHEEFGLDAIIDTPSNGN